MSLWPKIGGVRYCYSLQYLDTRGRNHVALTYVFVPRGEATCDGITLNDLEIPRTTWVQVLGPYLYYSGGVS